MTKAIRGRILKEANGDLEHLQKHIHLTNCIHLKNHMHKKSPNVSERSILRDLEALKRSRSLRDPSASPYFSSLCAGRNSATLERSDHNNLGVPEDERTDCGWGNGRMMTLSHRLDEDSDKASGNYSEKKGKVIGSGQRGKRRKLRTARRNRSSHSQGQKDTEISVASNSHATKTSQNVCGIPWNWSRIHDRGRTILDVAGRNLSCGASETKSKKGCSSSNESNLLALAMASDYSSSSEALPLLDDSSNWRSIHKRSRSRGIRHQSLTEKYIPKTFREIVGQNLVVQALTNAVAKKKLGFLYVFYGPHGTGKTSCARVFARALDCQSPNDDTRRPCGCCKSCTSHEKGKNRNIKEMRSISMADFDNIRSSQSSRYRVFIFDECDNFSSDYWASVAKIIDKSPTGVVFILICSTIESLPRAIISRCQKFFFPKLKDADVIYTLQWIPSRESIDIDKDALKLLASQCDGSLRDAETTLEQLSLLDQTISVPLVQEFAGLVSEDNLVRLLDLALSSDTINTVKHLREIIETGVEPIALMSQLATFITDILAGSYDLTVGRGTRKFFRHRSLTKEEMGKLRQALKALAEAEKQVRACNDKVTWLTAAVLQLSRDQPQLIGDASAEATPASREKGEEKVWREVLVKLRSINLRRFLYREGKVVHLSTGAGATAQLVFTSHENKLVAERHAALIHEAFEAVVGTPVTVEMKSESGGEIVELPPSRGEEGAGNGGVFEVDRSLVRGKVSLGNVLQAGGQQGGWSRRKAVSIAEKLEQQNLRLEGKSRALRCWKPPKVPGKNNRFGRSDSLLRFVCCGNRAIPSTGGFSN